MNKNDSLEVYYEATPNPQAMRFILTQNIASEAVEFSQAGLAARSPLAQKLLGFPWAVSVFIGPSFVTVTKQDWVDWSVIAEPLADLIKEHIQRGGEVLRPLSATPEDSSLDDANRVTEADSDIVRQIKEILNIEIRPAVAMDGGDIVFERFEEGRVYLQMRGACVGCPSSAMTLKEGIESRLKERLPAITEVISVN